MTVFTIPAYRSEELLAAFAKLAKIAAKLGVEAPTATKVGEIKVPVIGNDETGFPIRTGQVRLMFQYEVQGTAPKLADWTFIGTVEPTEAGNLVRAVPGHEIATSYQTAALTCEHCNVKRNRAAYFLVEKDGAVKSIGRQCLRDFLGHGRDPEHIGRMMELIFEITGFRDEDELGGGGSRAEKYWDTTSIVGTVLSIIAVDGFTPKSLDPVKNTTSTVWDLILPAFGRQAQKAQRELEAKYAGHGNVEEMSPKVIAWILALGDKEGRSNFENNLLIAARLGYVSRKEMGIFVAGVAIAARQINAEIARRATAQTKSNEWKGVVGERSTWNLIVADIRHMESNFGESTLVTFEDQDGNAFKWFASGVVDRFKVGESVTVKGTVKKHDEWKGRRQTMLSRVN